MDVSNKVNTIIILLLIIVMLGLTGYVMYDQFLINEEKQNQKEENKKVDDKLDEKVEVAISYTDFYRVPNGNGVYEIDSTLFVNYRILYFKIDDNKIAINTTERIDSDSLVDYKLYINDKYVTSGFFETNDINKTLKINYYNNYLVFTTWYAEYSGHEESTFVVSKDGKITDISEINSANKGLRIDVKNGFKFEDDGIVVEADRFENPNKIYVNGIDSMLLGNGFCDMSKWKSQGITENLIVSGVYKFEYKDGELNLNPVKISEKTTLEEYYSKC